MTESGAGPPPGDVPDDPRRLVLADLVARLGAGLATQARDYEAAARQAGGDLRDALNELARAKRAQAADLAPLASDLGVPPPPAPPPSEPRSLGWGVILGEAFQGERDLEGIARELAGLSPDPVVRVRSAGLAAAAARNRDEVRRLYLRYT